MAVAIQGDLGGISSFDIHGDPTTVGARWKKWRRSFELFACGKGVTNASQKKALLLHCGGPQMQDVYFTFPPARQPGQGETVYTVPIEQLDQYFTPQVNVPYERHTFRMMTQLPTESVDQFVTRLREKADCCEFGETTDENIRDQVIEKCLSNRLRRKLLETGRNLTLYDLQTIARAMEASDRQAGNTENSNQAKSGLNAIHGKQERRCFRCDNTGHTQEDKKCPARNKECLKCHKVGHFAKCCKTKETKGLQKKRFTKQKGHRGTVNHVNFKRIIRMTRLNMHLPLLMRNSLWF